MVWIIYTGLGILWIVLSLKIVVANQANQEMIAIMTMFQVSLGLLLLSVNAATSLAEERIRGSLDIILCTPLSTHSILVGKWWGSFLKARHVLAWPALLAGILAAESGRWLSYLLLLGLITAYCAAITSLGLAASHLDQSARTCRCARLYLHCILGWLDHANSSTGDTWSFNERFLVPMVMGSPLYGTIFATFAVAPGDFHLPGGVTGVVLAFGAILWTTIYCGVAMLLFMSTLATFDRCLGRVSEVSARFIPLDGKKAGEFDPDVEVWLADETPQF